VCSDTGRYASKYLDPAHARNESEQSNNADFARSRSDFDAAESRRHASGRGSDHSLYPDGREQWRPTTELVPGILSERNRRFRQ
jgi:hypothetical protein